MTTFAQLQVGQAFRIRAGKGYIGGRYFKTGENSYGLRAGAAMWDVKNLNMPVEVKS
jgi:hypothetical protein